MAIAPKLYGKSPPFPGAKDGGKGTPVPSVKDLKGSGGDFEANPYTGKVRAV